MSSPSPNLDGIRVQTARMLEIYSLLRHELDHGDRLGLDAQSRHKLQGAVDTIAANMKLLASRLAAAMESPSTVAAAGVDYPGIGHLDPGEARELEGILDAVLRWHADLIRETGD